MGLVPDGFHLETSRRYFGLLFRLLPGAHPMSRRHLEGRTAIPVPERLTRPHNTVSALRSEKRLSISKAAQARALLLAQGLAAEAERRGHGVALGKDGHHLVITVNGYSEEIKILEQEDRVPHEPTGAELRQKQRNPWTRIPDFDPVPTGRLTFELDEAWNSRQRRWADGKRQRLEDRLWDLLNEIETRATEAEQHRIEKERRERERQDQWERAMARARARYIEHGLTLQLCDQVDRWSLASRLRQYCDALDQLVSEEPPDESSAREWATWARSYTESIDPLREAPTVPAVPDPKAEDLKPFLDGWSPYGPETGFRW